ncbi:nuclear factor NF-kappa-B p100 subunit isoform X2 [Dunckerocampus dactyliophorus]|uniref:nuclear factor NF-kappa-B p100 subunit isoform X2 n=1 Tax=Dunckerocampus dactyliophorus TaxID=161453 RepID=UPI00240753A1|nr:nuclear factor NF-kappa-B p100 subunit isoform X2 [Dunckerocampus dactyliophorus]
MCTNKMPASHPLGVNEPILKPSITLQKKCPTCVGRRMRVSGCHGNSDLELRGHTIKLQRMTDAQFMNVYDNSEFNLMPYDYIPPVDIKTEAYIPETAHGPYIQIIEEPKQRGFRFRYECEGPSHGGLPGASSEKNRRTYPTVKINNYVGHARVEVQLVSHTEPPRVHAHSLVGRHCNENGTCTLDIGPNDLTASFSNLGILHVTKKGVVEVLTRRLRDEWRRQRGGHAHLTESEESAVLKEAKELSKVMDLNIVRLKFTAFLKDSNGGFSRALKPVVSNAIYDSKSPNASNLKISRMDTTCGSVLGGDEIFLLCDKVQKDDIEIRFYEDEEGGWEAFGDFAPTDVHKQYAIVFKTPPYHSAEIERPVTVFLQLKRKKAGDCSDPKHFTYIPHVQDKEEVLRKKQKPLPHHEPWPGGGARRGGGGAGGFGGGGSGGEGFHFNQHMNGAAGGGGRGGVFPPGNFIGFCGGAQMSGSTPQQSQRQLSHMVAALHARVSRGARQTAAALLQYCTSGDARVLLEVHRHLCSMRDTNGDTPLHLAVIHQQTGVVQQLTDTLLSNQQAHVLNATNHLQQTPLHLAVITHQAKVAETLLRAGADPTRLDKDGRSPLHLAALAGDSATLRPLLAHLGEGHAHLLTLPDYHGLHPLHLAVRRDGERCLRLLVEGGAKINAPELKGGHTPLHLAVRENLFKTACVLITELKADVNARTFGGNTPLHLAAAVHSHTLCSMLVAAGADKEAENDEPLVFSSSSDEDEEEEVGKAASPSVACRKRQVGGHTPLDLAKCHKVRKLLSSTSSRPPGKKVKGDAGQGAESSCLDRQTLTRLLHVLSGTDVPWRKLAEKLGMMTLTHLYQDSPAPCQHLLQHYQLGGGPLEGLRQALQSLGLTDGVRLLTSAAERPSDKHDPESTVDSGFSSQPMEEEQPPVANQ